jgi:F-type H+-transporting ATPase subunit b
VKEAPIDSATDATTHAVEGTEVIHPAGFDWDATLHNAHTWVFVSFVIFVALVARYLLPKINKGLDGRADAIRDQLEQASRLRAEAEALLASYQREQQLKEAESIIEAAKRDAAALRETAAQELKLSLDRRAEQAKDKIARAEAEAVNAIRTRIIKTATEKARVILAQRAAEQSEDEAVARAIAVIGQQVH